ncbi:hypothetical protein [Limosilactobacillus vaginalis]|uniref:hypothetical protein n=1 Tax=Limosilactobacillus vaginalis TaxID=1633 RepID=UPI001F0984FB|nr:hypothetical protein [Limosilactobacillus vaginalis]
MNLNGFETIMLVSGKDTMTVSNDGVSFSQATIAQLGKPEYVKAMINGDSKQFAIQVTNSSEPAKIPFLKRKKKTLTVRWNNSVLKNELSEMMKWNLQAYTYRINGKYYKEDQLMIFDLKDAKKSQRK